MHIFCFKHEHTCGSTRYGKSNYGVWSRRNLANAQTHTQATQLMSHAGTSHSFVAPSFPLLRALMHFSLPGFACQRITVSFGVGVFSSCASVRTLPHCNEMLIFTKYFSSYRMRHMMQSNKSISTNCARSFTYIYIFCSHLVKLWIGIHYDFWVAS